MKKKITKIVIWIAVGTMVVAAIAVFSIFMQREAEKAREMPEIMATPKPLPSDDSSFGFPGDAASFAGDDSSYPFADSSESVWESADDSSYEDSSYGEESDIEVDEEGWTSNASWIADLPEGPTPTATLTPTPSPTATPSPTPTPTPTPTPPANPTLASYSTEAVLAARAGTVLPEHAVDSANVSQFFVAREIVRGDAVFNRINGKSYRDNPDIPLSQLRYLKLLHRNYEGRIQVGEMVCNASVAQDLLVIFRDLFLKKYQIYSIRLVDDFWAGDALATDEASVRANNTSAFNYRRAADAANLSNHALGRAVDINPRHNPYITYRGGKWQTDPNIDYASNEKGYDDPDRREDLPHAMTADDDCVQAFKARGFTWGGDWDGNTRDYQHFEKLGAQTVAV